MENPFCLVPAEINSWSIQMVGGLGTPFVAGIESSFHGLGKRMMDVAGSGDNATARISVFQKNTNAGVAA